MMSLSVSVSEWKGEWECEYEHDCEYKYEFECESQYEHRAQAYRSPPLQHKNHLEKPPSVLICLQDLFIRELTILCAQ